MGSGCRDLSKAMESGEDFTTTAISASGLSPRLMATAFTLGKMETATKANGTCVSSTVRALTFFRTMTPTPANTKMESHMEKASTLGTAGRLTWAILWEA